MVAQETHVNQICLISHVEIVDHRGLIQVRELCHIVCLVELGRIDFINGLGIDFSLLDCRQQSPQVQLNFLDFIRFRRHIAHADGLHEAPRVSILSRTLTVGLAARHNVFQKSRSRPRFPQPYHGPFEILRF